MASRISAWRSNLTRAASRISEALGYDRERLVASSYLCAKRLEIILRPVEVSTIDCRPDIDSELASFPCEGGPCDE